MIDERSLTAEAGTRATRYLGSVNMRRGFPDHAALDALFKFSEDLPDDGRPAEEGLALLDDVGSPGTVTSNGPRPSVERHARSRIGAYRKPQPVGLLSLF